jgi:ABC-type sugar transport system substrate-binding protein
MHKRFIAALTCCLAAAAALAGCGSDGYAPAPAQDRIVLGFSQVGAESGWRTANTTSIKEAAKAAGIDLRFSDAQQRQENQIAAIRSFIAQKVDVIAFSPMVESGWDTVLGEAKTAGIPVILTDRAIDSANTTLYRTLLGSDFVAEGKSAAEWLVREYRGRPGPVSIVELQGTTGSAPANDRRTGFAGVIAADPKFTIIASQSGNFTRAKGREVMESILKAKPHIDVLYAHNDDMALGAIGAIEAVGLKPGTDIKIVSVDAVHDGMQALADGKINYIVECSPLLGPQLMQLVAQAARGETMLARIVTDETTFTQEQAKAALPDRKY